MARQELARVGNRQVVPFGRTEEQRYDPAPNNIEAEQALLGAILKNNDAYFRVVEFLRPDHFFEEFHQLVYEVCGELISQNLPASPITLKTYISDRDLGGLTTGQYMIRMAKAGSPLSSVRAYGTIIYEQWARRQMLGIAQTLAETALNAKPEEGPGTALAEALGALFELKPTPDARQEVSDVKAEAMEAAAAARHAFEHEDHVVGLSTGIPSLDRGLGGLQNSDLLVLAGRPGMGKTALATNIAWNVSKYLSEEAEAGRDDPGVVLFFSLEMSGRQLATRVISTETGIPAARMRKRLPREDVERIEECAREITAGSFKIDDRSGHTISLLSLTARKVHRKHRVRLIVIDYIQLMQGSQKRKEPNRVQDITEITTGLKALAKELDIPIVALSQLSRQVEQRDDKRPLLSDLRESGSIEQDADVVMFVFREEYYIRMKQPQSGTDKHLAWEEELEGAEGRAEVILAKMRHGATATIELGFRSETMQFVDEKPERVSKPRRQIEMPVKLTGSDANFVATLWKAIEDFGEPPPAGVTVPEGVTLVVSRAKFAITWRQHGEHDLQPNGDANAAEKRFGDALANALKRAMRYLAPKGVFGVHKDSTGRTTHLWYTGRRVHGVPGKNPFRSTEDRNARQRQLPDTHVLATDDGPDEFLI